MELYGGTKMIIFRAASLGKGQFAIQAAQFNIAGGEVGLCKTGFGKNFILSERSDIVPKLVNIAWDVALTLKFGMVADVEWAIICN